MTFFAERKFTLRSDEEVVLRLYKPQPAAMDWQCEMELRWPDRQSRRAFFGIDGVQALFIAMQLAHAELLASPEYAAGELSWLGATSLGLPALDAPSA